MGTVAPFFELRTIPPQQLDLGPKRWAQMAGPSLSTDVAARFSQIFSPKTTRFLAQNL
jgi:hypothetical protein